MWDLIVSVPDHCLSFYFTYLTVFESCLFHESYMPSRNKMIRLT